MSGGPTLTGSDKCAENLNKKYINITIEVEDYCTYDGCCEKYALLFHRDEMCLLCKHRKYLDIPELIRQRKEER